jgi:predicted amidophosphoribosyltransferase
VARGYNQAALLARQALRDTGVRIHFDLLRRVRNTRSQAGLDPRTRRRNVDGAFAVVPRRARAVAGSRILLVDDVLTTGATAGSCALALLDAGAERVLVLTLARVVP